MRALERMPMSDASTCGHFYVSTACQHYRHNECRRVCKFCPSMCLCPCHKTEANT